MHLKYNFLVDTVVWNNVDYYAIPYLFVCGILTYMGQTEFKRTLFTYMYVRERVPSYILMYMYVILLQN